ncbi:MAG: diphosphomevalonate decarboxylase [Bdellovibrio sp.]|nr:diphosphomevalonate decarboxylase [Bdellovibrio sp.]
MWVESSAPSNIALIKYMGKSDVTSNRPMNSSLSFALDRLRTFVRIQKIPKLTVDKWQALEREDLRPIELSANGREKFLNHFALLKIEFKMTGFFQIESANNFPSDCGLASSASSFAALTMAAHEWRMKNSEGPVVPYRPKELAKLSQKGSGSSCRSFFSPWSLWHLSGAEAIQLPQVNLKHQVILCDESIKSVSSSQAHKLVLTSDLFKGRPERAEERLQNLIQAMRKEDWKKSFEICWSEFWDMHVLFHTSVPAFIYMNEMSLKALRYLNNYWQSNGDGPIVTMDAGSNIHLLYRPDQQKAYDEIQREFSSQTAIWSDEGYRAKQS